MIIALVIGGKLDRYHVEDIGDGRYWVRKEGADHRYLAKAGRCSCPAWWYRRKPCRHLVWLQRVGLLPGEATPPAKGDEAALLDDRR